MKPRILSAARLSFPLAAALAALLAAPSLFATTLYWDGVTPAGAPGGGAGTWNTSTTNWDTSLNGGDIAWTNANLDTAFFGGTAGTVTLGTSIDVGGLFFTTTAYGITSTGFSLNFAAADNIIRFNNIAAATITGPVGGSGNVILTASNASTGTNGSLTLSGTSAGGWTGSTTINAGMTLALGTTAAGGPNSRALLNTSDITINSGGLALNFASGYAADRVSDTAPITVNGGGTVTIGTTNSSLTENIGAVTLASGQLNFVYINNPSSGGTITMAGFTRSGSTSALTVSSSTNGAFYVTGASSTTAGEILGPWATTGGQSGTSAQTDYAVYNGTKLQAAGIGASLESTWSTTAVTTSNYTMSALASGTLSATRNLNSLRATNNAVTVTANSPDIALASHTLAVGDIVTFSAGTMPTGLTAGTPYYVVATGAGTIQVSATSGGTAITPTTAGATVVAAGGILLSAGNNLGTTGILNGAATTLNILQSGGAGSVTLPTTTADNLYVTPGSGAITIPAPITDNTGALTLVKDGSGTLTLSGTNTFTGGTVINAGTLTLSNQAAWGNAGSRNITFNGGGTLTGADGQAGNQLSVGSGAVANISGNNLTFATATGSGTLVYNAAAIKNVNLGNASSFNGTLKLKYNGNFNYVGATAIQFSSLGDGVGSALQFESGQSDSNQGAAITLTGDVGPLTFDNRQVQILDRTTGNWELRDNILANNNTTAANKWVINTDLLYLGGRAQGGGAETGRNFILSGTNTGDNQFAGKISDGVVAGVPFNVQKTGASKWIVSGNNTYTGNTTVTAGTLVLSGTNQYTGSTNVSGGMLVGIGANAFGSTSGISMAATVLSLRGDSSTNFVKASDLTPYSVTTSATGATLNADQATVAGTSAKTMTIGNLGTSSTAATYQLNFTGANNTSLTVGAVTGPASTAVAGVTISNNIASTGILTLASYTSANTAGGENLTFTGSGNTTVTGAITPSATSLSLTKSGAGTTTLSGTNGYTGATIVGSGTLLVNGSLAAGSAVAVNGTSTLGGGGTIGGSVTVAAAANVSPGAPVGTLSIGGGLNVSAMAGGTGKLKYELATIAASDKIDVTGTLAIGTDVLGFSDFVFTDLPGLQDGTYTLITTTGGITGSLDPVPANLSGLIGTSAATGTLQINGNNLELVVSGLGGAAPEIAVEQPALTDIANGGSKSFGTVTLGSNNPLVFTIRNTGTAALNLTGTPLVAVSGANAGDFTVTVAPTTPVTSSGGTTTFTVQFAPSAAGVRNAVLTIANDDSDEGTFTINISGTGQTQYDAWSGGAAFDADTNGDGINNGVAWLLGAANKDVSAIGLLPVVTQSGGNLVLTFKCLNAAKRGAAVLKVQYSKDLGITDLWASHDTAVVPGTAPTTITVGGVDFVSSVFDADLNTMQATIPASAAAPGTKLFGRLKGEQ